MSEIDEFRRGNAMAFDPQPAGRSARVDGEAVTSGMSWWHTRICRTCGHTFRRGDRVLVDADAATVGHLDPTLGCVGGPAGGPTPVGADVHAFSAALLDAWPVGDGVVVTRTDDTLELLAPPHAGFRRACCLFCAHTFRPGEMVVVCPCRLGLCHRAVHRDPARGLVCWESWRPDSRVKVCPVLLVRNEQR